MPGSRDTWGLMREADLEKVYRERPASYRSRKVLLGVSALALGGEAAMNFGLA